MKHPQEIQKEFPFLYTVLYDFLRLSISLLHAHHRFFLSRQLNKINSNALNNTLLQQLHSIDINQVNAEAAPLDHILSTVDAMEVRLTKAINAAFDIIDPVRKITIRNKEKPWVKPDLLALIKERDRNFKAASSLDIPALVAKVNMLCWQVSNRLDTARAQYPSNRLKKAPSSKARWNKLRSMGTLKPKLKDAMLFFCPQDLNEHFAAIVNRFTTLWLRWHTDRPYPSASCYNWSSLFE